MGTVISATKSTPRVLGALAFAGLIGAGVFAAPATATAGPEASTQSEAETKTPVDLTNLHAEYRFVGGEKQRTKLQQAIDAGIKGLPAGLYELAHRRISKTQRAWPTMRLDITGKDIRVDRGPEKAAHTTAKKTKFVLTNRYGERYVYRQTISGRTLKQVVTGLGNKTLISFKFNEDGSRLQFKMTIDADLLPRPITYHLTYARVD